MKGPKYEDKLKKEPIYHDVDDCLPQNHPLAWDSVYCKECNCMLHASNNEFMQPWFETELGNFCWDCFGKCFVFWAEK